MLFACLGSQAPRHAGACGLTHSQHQGSMVQGCNKSASSAEKGSHQHKVSGGHERGCRARALILSCAP